MYVYTASDAQILWLHMFSRANTARLIMDTTEAKKTATTPPQGVHSKQVRRRDQFAHKGSMRKLTLGSLMHPSL